MDVAECKSQQRLLISQPVMDGLSTSA